MVNSFNRGLLILISGITTILIIVVLRLISIEAIIVLMFVLLEITSSIILSASSSLSTILGREKGMGQVMGFLGTATSLGAVIGPLVLGALDDFVSVDSTFIFLIISWVLAMFMLKLFYGKGKKYLVETKLN